jgi:hypothetical protein
MWQCGKCAEAFMRKGDLSRVWVVPGLRAAEDLLTLGDPMVGDDGGDLSVMIEESSSDSDVDYDSSDPHEYDSDDWYVIFPDCPE